MKNTPEEFRKYAAACKVLAKLAKNPQSKAVWKGIAERWLLCAKLEEDEEQALRRRLEKKALAAGPRRRHHAWAIH